MDECDYFDQMQEAAYEADMLGREYGQEAYEADCLKQEEYCSPDYWNDIASDGEADADALSSAGFGDDESYRAYEYDCDY